MQKMTEQNKRTEMIFFRLSPKEKKILQKRAKSYHSVSEYVRIKTILGDSNWSKSF